MLGYLATTNSKVSSPCRPQVLHKRAHQHRRKAITRIVIRDIIEVYSRHALRPAVRLVVSEFAVRYSQLNIGLWVWLLLSVRYSEGDLYYCWRVGDKKRVRYTE